MRIQESSPFFSVVIPLFEKEPYIGRCIDSVLAQSYSDFQVIVVDDGSKDNGPSIVRSYDDPRLSMVRQANGGVSVARNRGISEARGKWVAFLDADDEYLPSFLEEVRNAISAYPNCGACFARSFADGGDAGARPAAGRASEPKVIDNYDLFLLKGGSPAHTSSMAIKREIFDETGMFPVGVRIGEDTDMWMRVGWVTQYVFLDKELAIYHEAPFATNWKSCKGVPFWLSTCENWISEKRIPTERLDGAHALLNWGYCSLALGLGVSGNRDKGKQLFRGKCTIWKSPKGLYVRALLVLYFPGLLPLLVSAGRRIKRRNGRSCGSVE